MHEYRINGLLSIVKIIASQIRSWEFSTSNSVLDSKALHVVVNTDKWMGRAFLP